MWLKQACALVQKQSDIKLLMSIQFKAASVKQENKSLIFFKIQPYLLRVFGEHNDRSSDTESSWLMRLPAGRIYPQLEQTHTRRQDWWKPPGALSFTAVLLQLHKVQTGFVWKMANETSFTQCRVHSLHVQSRVPVASFTAKRENVVTDDNRG